MVNIFSRKASLIRLPVLKGQVTFQPQQSDAVKHALQLILKLALEVETTEATVSLERIERFNFGIVGARWAVEGGILAVSLYPKVSETAIEISAGSKDTCSQAFVLSIRQRLIELLKDLERKNGDCKITWFQSGAEGDAPRDRP